MKKEIDTSVALNESNFLKRFNFSRGDWIGIFGIILGCVISTFFWWISEKSREVRITTNPVITQIVNKGIASNLDVKYKGKEVTENLFAVQIAVWNAGKEPVRREDIISEVLVVVPDGLQVLESAVIKSTRPEIAFEVRDVSTTNNRYRLDWRILEKEDGGIIQFLCTGDKTLRFQLTGTVVGQGSLATFQLGESVRSWLSSVLGLSKSDRALDTAKKSGVNVTPQPFNFRWFGWIIICMGIAMFVVTGRHAFSSKRANRVSWKVAAFVGASIFYIFMGIVWLVIQAADSPFGF